MNIAFWVLAGGLVGWLSYFFWKAIDGWGVIAAILIGALGGFAGGNVIAPMLGAGRETPNEFSLFSMVIAVASAGALLAIGNLASRRQKS